MLDWLVKVVPFVQTYPGWIQGAVAAWIVLTAILGALLVVTRPTQVVGGSGTSSAQHRNVDRSTWQDTGDRFVDNARHTLNSLAARDSYSEADLVDALRHLFDRPAYFHVREESVETFLYGLCGTQDLLEHYVGALKTDPAVRDAIRYATTRVIKLKQLLATQYGPAFDVDRHYSLYGSTRDQFVERLPARQKSPDEAFDTQARSTLAELDKTLRAVGLK